MSVNVGVVAAIAGELKPLVRGWQREGTVYQGRVGEANCYAVAEGMGAGAATRGVGSLVAAAGRLDALVSYGWAGSLVNEIHPPAACLVGQVIESRTGERYRTEVDGPTLVTMDHVVARSSKRALAARYGASLVDMEAATVARLARARDIPFFGIKGISDGVEDDLPDFNAFTSAAGRLQMPALLSHVAMRPRYWSGLRLLAVNSSRAAASMAELLSVSLRSAGLIS